MAASRKSSNAAKRLLFPGWSFASISGAILLLSLITGFVYTWQIWGPEAMAFANEPLTVEHLQITPQPEWIRSPIKEEAFRDGSLGELSLLEKDLTYKVYNAFELHPWVLKVDRVSKHPDGMIYVDLHFRRPVAWVEIPSDMSSLNEAGVLPIDDEAVILPPEDLQGQLEDFIRIAIPDLQPWGLKGTPWGDPRLVGAARLARMLEGIWQGLNIRRIRVTTNAAANLASPFFELVTKTGQRIVWGSAPGEELSGEAPASQKLIRLKQGMGKGITNSEGILDLRLAGRQETKM